MTAYNKPFLFSLAIGLIAACNAAEGDEMSIYDGWSGNWPPQMPSGEYPHVASGQVEAQQKADTPEVYSIHALFAGNRGTRGNKVILGPGQTKTLIDLFAPLHAPAAFSIQLNTNRIESGTTPADIAILEWGFENSINYAEFNVARGATVNIVGNRVKLQVHNAATVAGTDIEYSATMGLGIIPREDPPVYTIRRTIDAGLSNEDFFWVPYTEQPPFAANVLPADRVLPPRARSMYVFSAGGNPFTVEQAGFQSYSVLADTLQGIWAPISRSARYVRVTNDGPDEDSFEVQFRLDL